MTHSDWRDTVTLAYIDEPPFGWTQADGAATGADVELADTILRAIGVKTIIHHATTFAELLPGVENEQWDINVPLFVTAERATRVNFSVPVWAIGDGFLVRAGNPMQLTDYASLARRADARLGIITGQVQHLAATHAGVSAAQITPFDKQSDATDALRSGAIDAYASTALGNRIVAERIGTGVVSAVAHEAGNALPLGAFSFSKRNRSLLDAFDRQLRIYLGSTDHRERMGRYGFTAAEIDPVVSR
jgi:polar amino acid transport system substrate-binding protein